MSGLDTLNDDDLANVACAIRAWTQALDSAGMRPAGMVTPKELEAAQKLSALYPREDTGDFVAATPTNGR